MMGSMRMVTVFQLITSNIVIDMWSFRPILLSFRFLRFRHHLRSQGGTYVAE